MGSYYPRTTIHGLVIERGFCQGALNPSPLAQPVVTQSNSSALLKASPSEPHLRLSQMPILSVLFRTSIEATLQAGMHALRLPQALPVALEYHSNDNEHYFNSQDASYSLLVSYAFLH